MNRIVRVTIASVICALPFISNAQLDVKPLSVNAKELQDEISIVTSKIDSFIAMLEELSALLSAHIHPDAINRHFAK